MTVVPITPNPGGELARYERPPAPIARVETPGLDTWLPLVREIAYFADYVGMTEFVPSKLRGKPAAITAAIIAGRELGLGPMASMKHVQIVEGTPSLSAEMARALVQARGHEIKFREMSGEQCIIAGRRRGEQEWTVVTFTMKDARDGGLLEPGKSGKLREGWVKWKRRMLVARASSELCHAMFADCLNGMAIADESHPDADDQRTESSAATSDLPSPAAEESPERGRLLAAIAAAVTADDLNAVAGEVATAERNGLAESTVAELRAAMTARAAELPAGQKALKRMLGALGALGLLDDDQRKQAAGNVVGRTIASTSELTGAEADTVWRRAAAAAEDGGAASLLYAAPSDEATPEPTSAEGGEPAPPESAGVSPEEIAAYEAQAGAR